MLDWLLNPEGVSSGAYMILWAALLIIVPVSIIAGIVQTIRASRRDKNARND